MLKTVVLLNISVDTVIFFQVSLSIIFKKAAFISNRNLYNIVNDYILSLLINLMCPCWIEVLIYFKRLLTPNIYTSLCNGVITSCRLQPNYVVFLYLWCCPICCSFCAHVIFIISSSMNEVVHTSPTIGSNVEEIVVNNTHFLMWDIGGQESLRSSWNTYYTNTEVNALSQL